MTDYESIRTTRTAPALRRAALVVSVLISAALPFAAGAQVPGFPGGPPGPGGFPGGRGGPGMMGERKIVAQFDADKDNRLDATERKAAREWLSTQFGARPGPGGRGRGGRGFAPSSPGLRLTPADVKAYATAPLYDVTTLRTMFLQFDGADWEQELAAFNNTDVEVPAVVTVDGKAYKDVGVHFRGASSFFMVPTGSKRSLNLAFDFVNKDQRIGGYRTLNLLNSNGDPTFVRALLYGDIARSYVPTPKMNYVRVAINGENWGVYVNAQQFNADFLRDFFKTTSGARWKVPGSPGGRAGLEYIGDDAAPYKRIYEIKTKDDAQRWVDLINLTKVLNQTPPGKLEAALSPILDVDGALKFLAIEVALVNSDGYWTRASDYSLYQDAKRRFHIIPHDINEGLMEEGFGRGGRGPGGFGPPPPDPGRGLPPDGGPVFLGGRGFGGGRGGVDLDPLVGLNDPTKPLRSKLLAVPALRERYLSYVRDVAQRWLDWKKLEPLVKQYQSVIAEEVKADTRKLYTFDAFQADVSESERSLKSFVERRRAFLLK